MKYLYFYFIKMKQIVIWDIHWRDIWKKILLKEKTFDEVIFMWDYFDSFDIPIDVQIRNFYDIIWLCRESKWRIVMLMWNHDYQYFTQDAWERYSWYNYLLDLQIFKKLYGLVVEWMLKVAYLHEDMLFTHAWVSTTWLKKHKLTVKQLLNQPLLLDRPEIFWFSEEDDTRSWHHVSQWPLWIRPFALMWDTPKWYKQVVGHTEMSTITILDESLYVVDALHNRVYMTISDWEIEIKKV